MNTTKFLHAISLGLICLTLNLTAQANDDLSLPSGLSIYPDGTGGFYTSEGDSIYPDGTGGYYVP